MSTYGSAKSSSLSESSGSSDWSSSGGSSGSSGLASSGGSSGGSSASSGGSSVQSGSSVVPYVTEILISATSLVDDDLRISILKQDSGTEYVISDTKLNVAQYMGEIITPNTGAWEFTSGFRVIRLNGVTFAHAEDIDGMAPPVAGDVVKVDVFDGWDGCRLCTWGAQVTWSDGVTTTASGGTATSEFIAEGALQFGDWLTLTGQVHTPETRAAYFAAVRHNNGNGSYTANGSFVISR